MKYFETIKCEDYEIFNLSYHEKRVANTIGLNINLQEYIYPPSNELLRCKLIYDVSGVLDVEFSPYKKREINTFKIVKCDEIEYSKKYLNREFLDELFSKKESCDDIIIIKNGLITDTTIANIALFIDDIWYTPKTPLLYGTTRNRYLSLNFLKERDLTFDDLLNCKKIALMNAMIDFDIKENYLLSL